MLEVEECTVSRRAKISFQMILSKDVASENGIEYFSDVLANKISSNRAYVNQFMAEKGKYISIYPPNDGITTCPIEWYASIDGKVRKLLDNQRAFKEITNMDEIIFQILNLYYKYIDDDILISSNTFALRLEDEIRENYVGRASLVITEETIRNAKINYGEEEKVKIYLINQFIDEFIGWNFGVLVRSNPELEKALLSFNELVISKGFRKNFGPGFEVWITKDVQHYKFRA